MKKEQRVSKGIRMSRKELEMLEALAENEGVSQGAMVRMLIRRSFDRRSKK